MPKASRYCTRCKFAGVHPTESEISGGQWALLVVLLLCGVIPGVIYGVYLAAGGGARSFWICPKCGARRMSVPLDAPIAVQERSAIRSAET